MDWAQVPLWITAITGLIVAVGGTVVTVRSIIPTHKLVNQQRTDMLRFQMVLINTLNDHGITIPEDQSKLDR